VGQVRHKRQHLKFETQLAWMSGASSLCTVIFGATTHTEMISMQAPRTGFPGRLISCFVDMTWPTFLPDLAVPDYFLWGYIERKVYITHPANTDDLKQ
jgi:hypothetical protein